jgi:argininosuccinate lyase
VPFREAHRRTGELLKRLADEGRRLADLDDEEWTAFGVKDGARMLDPDASVAARTMPGGPTVESVRSQADALEALVAARPVNP